MKDELRVRLCSKRWYVVPDDQFRCPAGGENVRMYTVLRRHRSSRTLEARMAYAWTGRAWVWEMPIDRGARILFFKPTAPFLTDKRYESVPLSEVQEHFLRSIEPR